MAKFGLSQLLNEQSKQEIEQLKKPPDIVLLPLDSLVPSEWNKYGIRDIEQLAENIEMVGLLHNLVVQKSGEKDKYVIISGERRYEALKLLVSKGMEQYSRAPCKIEDANVKNPEINELRLLFANATARDLTDYERTYQAQRIKELLLSLKKKGYKFQGRMRQIMADMLDVSPAQVGKMESISQNLSPEFKEKFKAGNINITTAYETSRLPQEQQAQLMSEFKKTGAVDVKNVQAKREREKPQPKAHTAPQPARNSMPAQNEIILKPCPFCGGNAEKLAGSPGISIVRCPACDIRVYRKSTDEAVEAWNHRV